MVLLSTPENYTPRSTPSLKPSYVTAVGRKPDTTANDFKVAAHLHLTLTTKIRLPHLFIVARLNFSVLLTNYRKIIFYTLRTNYCNSFIGYAQSKLHLFDYSWALVSC